MKNMFSVLCIFIFFNLKAQTNSDFLKEINRDIWQPFTEAYATLDVEKYKNLQTEDFIRAEGSDKRLPSYQTYFNNMGLWFGELRQYSRKLSIGFRFTERFANDKVASERGIYELKMFDSKGNEIWKGYGKFHVFMRKTGEKWKIVVDYDSNENNTVDEKMYLAAFAVDDLGKF